MYVTRIEATEEAHPLWCAVHRANIEQRVINRINVSDMLQHCK